MRILKFLLFFALVLHFSKTKAQNIARDTVANILQVQNKYTTVYNSIPSMLSNWKGTKWAVLSTSYYNEDRSFKSPQEYESTNGVLFNTESLSYNENSDWSFYGSFMYSTSQVDSVNNNLSYRIRENGNPYYFFMKKAGEWNLQNYWLKASVSKKMKRDGLSMGLGIKYFTNLYHRKTDTRNEQTKLSVKTSYGISYKTKNSEIWSAGLSLLFDKEKSKLSNKYQHPTQNLDYNIYFNAGLGSYLKNKKQGLVMDGFTPGLYLQWFKETHKNNLMLAYNVNFGKQEWLDESIRSVTSNNIVSKYTHQKHTFKTMFQHNYKSATLVSTFSTSYLKGSGNLWVPLQKNFLENFKVTKLTIDSETKFFLNRSSIVNSLGISFKILNNKELDKNYGSVFNYTNLIVEPNIYLKLPITNKVKIALDTRLIYTQNIGSKYFPNAATQNLYFDWIGEPLKNYVTTDVFSCNIDLSIHKQLKEQKVIFTIGSQMSNPVANYDIAYNGKYINNVNLGVKVFF